MEENIFFDVASIFLHVIIIFSILFRKTHHTTSGRIFFSIVIVSLLAAISDILSVLPYLGNTIIHISNSIYFLTRNLTAVAYCIYLISLTDTWHRVKDRLWLQLLLVIPYLIIILVIASNPFTHLLFTIDENLNYARGPLITILYICSMTYLIIGIVFITKYRKLFTMDKLISLYALFPLTLLSLLIQFLYPNLLVESFATSLSIFFLTITIERPEEAIDYESGLKKYSAFVTDIYKADVTRKKITIIICSIVNHQSYRSLFSYDELISLKKNIATAMTKEVILHSPFSQMYYLGDDRYGVVLNEEVRDKANEIAEGLKLKLNSNISTNHGIIDVFTNVCIVHFPEDINTSDLFLKFLENFNNTFSYEKEIIQLSGVENKNEFNMYNELDRIISNAIYNHKLEIYYQPIFSLKKKRFCSAEALLRLNDDKYGFIPPNIFIPASEKNGAIHKIGEYVIEEVCRFIASDDFEELGLDYIEINLSMIQCMQADLSKKIISIMEKYNISPDKINLEITETADAFSYQMMLENINELKEKGVKFSLDDYGTGYSNINRMSSLPLQIIKIDKSLVDSVKDPRVEIILKHSIEMIKNLNLEIVVEGIETKEMVDLFSNLGCEYIQGYYYSKPISLEDFKGFIKQVKSISEDE